MGNANQNLNEISFYTFQIGGEKKNTLKVRQ